MKLRRELYNLEGGFSSLLATYAIAFGGAGTMPFKYVGYSTICRMISRVLIRNHSYSLLLKIGDNSLMKVFLNDPYWSTLVAASYEYEHDFRIALTKLKNLEFVFIDCGANFGYWSILLSSLDFCHHRVLAIETSYPTFQILTYNCQLNNGRFSVLHRAVHSRSGLLAYVNTSGGHAGTNVKVDKNGPQNAERVLTISLDDAVYETFCGYPEYMIIKLDIEGNEIDALSSASKVLARDILLYYEDHGSDPESKTTNFVLEVLKLTVFRLSSNGNFMPINSAHEASQIKSDKSRGYNFFACKSNSKFYGVLNC
jgi:FkbM family methyltransferase